MLTSHGVIPITFGTMCTVCICYQATTMQLHKIRLLFSRENFLFNCFCPKCLDQENDPDLTSEEDMSEEDTE